MGTKDQRTDIEIDLGISPELNDILKRTDNMEKEMKDATKKSGGGSSSGGSGSGSSGGTRGGY